MFLVNSLRRNLDPNNLQELVANEINQIVQDLEKIEKNWSSLNENGRTETKKREYKLHQKSLTKRLKIYQYLANSPEILITHDIYDKICTYNEEVIELYFKKIESYSCLLSLKEHRSITTNPNEADLIELEILLCYNSIKIKENYIAVLYLNFSSHLDLNINLRESGERCFTKFVLLWRHKQEIERLIDIQKKINNNLLKLCYGTTEEEYLSVKRLITQDKLRFLYQSLRAFYAELKCLAFTNRIKLTSDIEKKLRALISDVHRFTQRYCSSHKDPVEFTLPAELLAEITAFQHRFSPECKIIGYEKMILDIRLVDSWENLTTQYPVGQEPKKLTMRSLRIH